LRGPAGSLGAVEVEALAAELERSGCEPGAVSAEVLIDSLRAAVERASVELGQKRARPAADARCAS
jgi:hypothetical protein